MQRMRVLLSAPNCLIMHRLGLEVIAPESNSENFPPGLGVLTLILRLGSGAGLLIAYLLQHHTENLISWTKYSIETGRKRITTVNYWQDDIVKTNSPQNSLFISNMISLCIVLDLFAWVRRSN